MATLHSISSGCFFKMHMVKCAGCAAYGSQMSQTIALKMVEASLATSMSYLSVVWGMLSGYVVFHEVCCLVAQILQCTNDVFCHSLI